MSTTSNSMRPASAHESQLLITGGSGQLARALLATSDDAWQARALDAATLDITRTDAVRDLLAALRPTVLINCAALTDTARCEREPTLAAEVNAAAPGRLAALCRDAGVYFIHISTNEVFDGQARTPYVEDAPAVPLNAYGASKRDGEKRVLAENPAALVVRTTWLYGHGQRNFVAKVLRWASEQQTLRLVSDEVATPTACTSLAAVLWRLLALRPAGVLHATDAGQASRLSWGREILRLAGLDPERAQPALLADFPGALAKPHYSVLSLQRLGEFVSVAPWQEALSAFMQTVDDQPERATGAARGSRADVRE
jgi:dTDP-4-dehydrorhamnose reductase